MAAFYRARVRFGDGLRSSFNWSVLRAKGDQRQTRTGSNLVDTDPRSAGHEGVLHGGARTEERGICGFFGEIEPSARSRRCEM
jgi:hypothetical protein